MDEVGKVRQPETDQLLPSHNLGVLFPPSIATIIYAWVANVSVADMFLASFLPAFLMAFSFCAVAY